MELKRYEIERHAEEDTKGKIQKLQTRCDKLFLSIGMDFSKFCLRKKLLQEGGSEDECYLEARFLFHVIITNASKTPDPRQYIITNRCLQILEDLQQTRIHVSSSEFLGMRRQGMDYITGATELVKFIGFNKSPFDFVAFAEECLETLAPNQEDRTAMTAPVGRPLEESTRAGISGTSHEIRSLTASQLTGSRAYQTISKELDRLEAKHSTAEQTLKTYQVGLALYEKENKGKRDERRRVTRLMFSDLQSVADLVNALRSLYGSTIGTEGEAEKVRLLPRRTALVYRGRDRYHLESFFAWPLYPLGRSSMICFTFTTRKVVCSYTSRPGETKRRRSWR